MPGPDVPPTDSHAAESSPCNGISGAHEHPPRSPAEDAAAETFPSRFDSYAELPPKPPDVWLHVYHCDPYTAFLNQAILTRNDVGIYHCGVEVYSDEWSFQYFEDTWDDPTVSGIIRCSPRQMFGYDYQDAIQQRGHDLPAQRATRRVRHSRLPTSAASASAIQHVDRCKQETVHLGVTSLSEEEVDKELTRLKEEWPACSYHLTRNNCLVFAEHFAGILKVPEPFPSRLKGILEASAQNQRTGAVVDYVWSWSKWWMLRKHGRTVQEAEPDVGERQPAGVFWLADMLNPTQACSSSCCMRSPTRCASEENLSGPVVTTLSLPAG